MSRLEWSSGDTKGLHPRKESERLGGSSSSASDSDGPGRSASDSEGVREPAASGANHEGEAQDKWELYRSCHPAAVGNSKARKGNCWEQASPVATQLLDFWPSLRR